MLRAALSYLVGSGPTAQKSKFSLEEASNGSRGSLLNSAIPVQQHRDLTILSYLYNGSRLFLGTIERKSVADNDRRMHSAARIKRRGLSAGPRL
jgi:hypothetical protein